MAAIYKTGAGGEAVRASYAAFLAHWPTPHEQHRIPTKQGETFVVACGPPEAPAVVLLHGSGSNTTTWMGDAAVLAQRLRVYAVDMIGEPGFSAPSRPALASDELAVWLDQVLAGLGVTRAALVGVSLGGWLALHYATRHPERVNALVLLCPGGVGRQRALLLLAAPLMLMGAWGRNVAMAWVLGTPPSITPSAATKAMGDFLRLIFTHFRPRTEQLPVFTDRDLARLTMPLLTILGAKDVILDSAGTRRRLTQAAVQADVIWLPQAGHMLVGHGADIERFRARALVDG